MGLPVLGSTWGLLQARASAKPRRCRILITRSTPMAEPMTVMSTGSRVGLRPGSAERSAGAGLPGGAE